MAGDQVIRLNYLQWQAIYAEEKPYQVFSNISEKDSAIQQTTNLVFQPGELETIHDARGIEETFDLDTEGFKFATHQTRVCNFKDRRLVEGEYFQEMEQLLRKHVQDVDQVYFFDWRVLPAAPATIKFI
ncbi:hypothetical protein MMC10_000148 [Thelotrema lepadinum]|nr:hypothetical protein [Thelotrema lepadinum]